MIRRFTFLAPLAALALTGAFLGSPNATAQNETVLAEVYGRGVHAYYAGQYTEAYDYLSAAIDGGTRDPRAYYFRGIVSYNQGRQMEAEADWTLGAQMEAQAGGGDGIGRSLSRFQGSARIKLEGIRQKERLSVMLNAATRSDIRMQELGVQPNPTPAAPALTTPAAPVAPAPAAPTADDPFADDPLGMAGGNASVEAPNALDGLDGPLEPLGADPAIAPADAGGMPAAGGDGSTNPFGDSAPAADTGTDPFGTGGGADPFGSTPPTGGADPFGGDPFGN